MANANTNLMSVSSSSKSITTTSQSGSKYKTAEPARGKDNFNTHLDRATAQANQNQTPPEKVEQVAKVEGEAQDASASIQGQNTKTQDAPQQEDSTAQAEKVSDAEEVADAVDGQENPAIFSYFFSANTETLLAPKMPDAESDGNLMTIMPQSSGSNSQAMLDLLGGKTWTSADVDAEFQNLNQPIPAENVQTVQPTLQAQTQPAENVQTVQPTLQAQTQPAENMQTVQPTLQAQTQPAENMQAVQPTLQAQTQQVQPQLQNLQTDALQPQLTQQIQQIQQSQPQLQSLQTDAVQSQQTQQSQPQLQNLQTDALQPQQIQPVQPQLQSQAQQFGAKISPIVNSVQPQAQTQQNQPTAQNLADMLGAPVQVEDGTQFAPTTPTQPTPQQFEQNNSQSQEQNFAQNLTQSTAPEIQQTNSQAGSENFAANFAQVSDTPQPIQEIVQVENPEATANVREDFNVPGQIVEQARLIRTAQSTEMVINLKPEHLGELTLRISVNHSGTLNANFYSDNAQVRAIIENSLVQLKQELSNAGIKVENVEVFAGLSDGGLGQGQGQAAWQQNQQQRNSNRKIDFSAFEDETDAIQPTAETADDGVDYRV